MPAFSRRPRLAFMVVAAITSLLPPLRGADIPVVKPAAAAERAATGEAIIIDVREAAEWQETGVVASAVLLPLSDLRGDRTLWREFLARHRDKELILYCRSGNRSGQAAKILAEEGFEVANAGGFSDWLKSGQPTRKLVEPPPEQ